jgi:hypothetical protein
MWNILTFPTVWYFVTVKISNCRNSKNITHCWGQLKYHNVGTVRIFDIVVNNVEYSYFSDSVVF